MRVAGFAPALFMLGRVTAIPVAVVLTAVSMVATTLPDDTHSDWIVRETSLGPLGDDVVVSANRRHVARVVRRGDKRVVLCDRTESPEYQEVKGLEAGALQFSPDNRLAYVATRKGGSKLVLDGREVAAVEVKGANMWAWGPGLAKTVGLLFAPHGSRWVAGQLEGGSFVRLFYEGQDQLVKWSPPGRTTSPCLSLDGARIGFKEWPRWGPNLLQVYGPEGRLSVHEAGPPRTAKFLYGCWFAGAPDWGTCEFSPDGRQVAYAVVLDTIHVGERFFGRDASCRLMLDGTSLGDGQELKWPVFSPDGARLSFPVMRSGKWWVVVEGREEGPYDDLADGWDALGRRRQIFFSADGRRLGYGARKDWRRWFVVVDGSSGRPYEKLGRPVFSPDGARVAHRAMSQGKWLVVVDDRPGKPYDEIESQTFSEGGLPQEELLFSSDGGRIAYRAKSGGRWLVVVDGQEGPAYDEVAPVAFSPDGMRVAYAAKREGKWLLVVDGVEGQSYDFLTDRRIVFDGTHQLHTVVRRGGEYLLLEVEIPRAGPAR